MSKFFLRTKQKSGTAFLYVRVNRPKMGISWWVCSRISVDIETWKKARKDGRSWERFCLTEKGEETERKIKAVERVIIDFFEKCSCVYDNDKTKLEKEIVKVVDADSLQTIENADILEREKVDARLCVIVNYYDYFLDGIRNGTIRQKGSLKVYKDGSVRVWENFGHFLKKYCPRNMTFDQINKQFADGFVCFLEKCGLMPKTINKNVLCFRRLCNAAAVDEKNKNLISVKVWGERRVKDNEKRAEIALSDAEIDALYAMQLDGIREQVRDVWMLGFLSSQRVSDYTKFTRENFKVTPGGVHVIVLRQQKTGNDVVVPILDDRVFEICAKYNYDFPRVDVKDINRYIKEILKLLSKSVPTLGELHRTQLSMSERRKEEVYLNMKRRVSEGENLHGDELKRYKEMRLYAEEHGSGEKLWRRDYSGAVVRCKYELVSSHTSRRSAITNMYNTGLYDVRDMMSISGHTTLSNFENYIKRGSIEQAERIARKAQKERKNVALYGDGNMAMSTIQQKEVG